MNAAAKALGRESSQGWHWVGFSVNKESLFCLSLLFAVLISALSVIYFKNIQRSYYSELQLVESQENQLRLEWGQLLLEQSSWSTSSRVQRVAQDKLSMVIPKAKDIVIVKS